MGGKPKKNCTTAPIGKVDTIYAPMQLAIPFAAGVNTNWPPTSMFIGFSEFHFSLEGWHIMTGH